MTVTGSLIVSGSGTFTNIGPAVFSGSITSTAGFTGSFSGTATSASYASTASFVANAQTASYVLNAVSSSFATSAITASYADSLTVAGTLTAQTLVVQTITSSVDFVTGSTRFGSILGNTHVFSGSVTMNPGGLFVSSSGRVGIGTTTPGAPLEISYNNTSYTTTPILSLNNTNINGQTHINFLITGSLVGKIRSDYEGGMIYVTNNLGADRSHYFLVNGDVGTGSVAMAISALGRIGMGTSSPAARLDIQGGSDGDGMISIGSNSVSGILNSPANIYINADSDNNASGVIVLGFNRTGYTGGTEAVRILESGNVGISATSPARRLAVQGADDGTLQIRMQGSAATDSYCEIGRESYSTGDFRVNVCRSGTVINALKISDTTGAAIFSSTVAASGIIFPGSQVSSADPNNLDDYEEGTWTPTIAGGGGDPTYTSGQRVGWYTKVGRVVTITWFISFSKNTLSGTLRLTNFPFSLLNGPLFYPQGTVLLDTLGTTTNNITMQGANNSNSGDFIGGNGTTSTHTGLSVGVLGAGEMQCRGTLTYFTA
jgi:hypothetical protein